MVQAIFPSFEEFEEKYNKGTSQLVWHVIPADLETPVSALLKLMKLSPYHLLYESVEGGETRARYSIIALDPDLVWRVRQGKVEINTQFQDNPERFKADKMQDVFASFRLLLKKSRLEIPDNLPPMAAGLFGYMTYDMVRFMEALPDKNPDMINVPQSIYMRPRLTVIFDSAKGEAILITPVWVADKKSTAWNQYVAAEARLARAAALLKGAIPKPRRIPRRKRLVGPFKPNMNETQYRAVVNKAKEYIMAGDIFQVVPSRRMTGKFILPPVSLYRSLRGLNPSPYMFYSSFENFALIGSSPEILVRLKDGKVTIRPIAGTRPRGRNLEEDVALENDLLANQKELAEHLMLLDLGRNDVGRVAKPGTVRVTEQMVIERYSHVMHIVSNVEGDIRPGLDAVDALVAGFPAGTVTGAPKIRAMEIIDELETERRSFYGGTVGYFSSGGTMDTCIALRTGLIKNGKLYVQAGGGVVADSVPRAEFKETENKAGAVISAAHNASKYI
jgi:anthranilate synthase component 1